MIGALNLTLRLAIWFLLTADASWPNILIGVAVALILPGGYGAAGSAKDWLRTLWETLVAIPQAYIEAVEIMVRPHTQERVVHQRVKPRRTPGLVFLDIFLITFTPKTIVVDYEQDGWYDVHVVERPTPPSRRQSQ